LRSPGVAAAQPWRGGVRIKVKLQLAKAGILDCFEERILIDHEIPRSKPFPDVYLAAAAALGVNPKRCAVVEDTVTGVSQVGPWLSLHRPVVLQWSAAIAEPY
jgi:hypothetical protein